MTPGPGTGSGLPSAPAGDASSPPSRPSRPPRALALDAGLRLGSAVLGAMWLVGAATKAFEPAGAYEFTTRITGGGTAAKVSVAAIAAAEALLGTLMLTGAVRGYAASLGGLAAATWALDHVRHGFGGQVKCGCLALLADSTVDEALRRNGAAMAVAAALLLLERFTRRRATRGAEADPGPSRSGS